MVKGIDSVHSPSHPSTAYAGSLRSAPRNEPTKEDYPRQVYGDPNTAKSMTRERIYNILQALHSYAESARKGLKFHIHEDTGQIVVQVINREDDKVIREIPPEALLDLEARIDEMTGVIFSKGV